MARIVPLWRSDEISVHRFDHPVEHEDQGYEEVADTFMASFVEEGTFDLYVGEGRWRVNPGDVMLSHPGMRFRAGFQGKGFNDTCLSLTYLAANDDRFDPARSWAKAQRPVLMQSNRLRYLRWGLRRALENGAPMFAEYCATEIFRDARETPAPLFSEHKFAWYAERVHRARERVDTDFAEAFTVSELARSVGMSMFHFTRVFAELIGMPPHRYLLETRLKAARKMLREGRSVTETCFASGFGNLSHFSRSFARRFGQPPSRIMA
jgi:AraC family transcriptional regulator